MVAEEKRLKESAVSGSGMCRFGRGPGPGFGSPVVPGSSRKNKRKHREAAAVVEEKEVKEEDGEPRYPRRRVDRKNYLEAPLGADGKV